MKGTEFVEKLEALDIDGRLLSRHVQDRRSATEDYESALWAAYKDGAYMAWPFLRVQAGDVTFFAAADYFSVGTPDDYIRCPMSPLLAQRIADDAGYVLPTSMMVDLIWEQADIRYAPQPWGPPYDMNMLTVDRIAKHSRRTPVTSGAELIAGHKKDVVISNRLLEAPRRLGLYGWHRLNGIPIQGPRVSLAHEDTYYDYSHGIRFCKSEMHDGLQLRDALVDAKLFRFLSSEGPLRITRYCQPDELVSAPLPPDSVVDNPIIGVGSRGNRVRRWQVAIGVSPDGIFGPITAARTKAIQKAAGMAQIGSVSDVEEKLLRDYMKEQKEREMERLEDNEGLPEIKLVPARNYQKLAHARDINLIVLHSMEAAERPSTAENVAAWFAGPNAPKASAHYCIDNDSIVRCVPDNDIAWHAPGTNDYSIGIEHAGYANQPNDETGWDDVYSRQMLELSVKLVARLCKQHSIPVRFVDAKGLIAKEHGITTHAEVSRACVIAQREKLTESSYYNSRANKPRTNHYDPGPNFPLARYIEDVATIVGGSNG